LNNEVLDSLILSFLKGSALKQFGQAELLYLLGWSEGLWREQGAEEFWQQGELQHVAAFNNFNSGDKTKQRRKKVNMIFFGILNIFS